MKELYKQMLKIMEESTIDYSFVGTTFHHHSIKRGFGGLCSLLYYLDGGVGDNIRCMEYDASKYLGIDVKDLKLYWFTNYSYKAKQERIDFLKWAIKNIENEENNRKIKRVTD